MGLFVADSAWKVTVFGRSVPLRLSMFTRSIDMASEIATQIEK